MTMEIAFPQVGGSRIVAPAPPPSVLDAGLSSLATTPDSRASLSCKALLHGDTLKQANVEADRLVPALTENTQVLMTYGNAAVEEVNALYDRLMKDVEPEKIPEMTEILNGLNREMRGIRAKYDPANDDVRKKYANWKGGVGRFFGRAKTLLELLWEDVKPLEAKMSAVEKNLRGRQTQLLRNVTYYDLIYIANEEEVKKLIYRVAVMELARDRIAVAAGEIEVGNADLGDRGAEQKATLAELANNMDIRIGEFKSRLFIAWATSPQIRMMRSLNVTLASRLDNLISLTIPTMKGTILGWRMLIQSQEAATLATATATASNEALQAYASANAVAVPKIAQAASVPTLSLESVTAMAKSLEDQTTGVLEAFKAGAAGRADLEATIVQSGTAIRNTQIKFSEGLVDQIVARGQNQQPIHVLTAVKE